MIYLVLNLGISMKIHYCGDSISFIDFFPMEESNCCKDKKASCCKDKIAYINPETVQSGIQQVEFSFPEYAKFNLVVQDFSFLSAIESLKVDNYLVGVSEPVFYHKTPLFLAHRAIIV
jgi:hypothetical protein